MLNFHYWIGNTKKTNELQAGFLHSPRCTDVRNNKPSERTDEDALSRQAQSPQ